MRRPAKIEKIVKESKIEPNIRPKGEMQSKSLELGIWKCKL